MCWPTGQRTCRRPGKRVRVSKKGIYERGRCARSKPSLRLQDPQWSASLGRAIAARFHEVIVDEAQDCNPLDLELLTWLRGHGLASLWCRMSTKRSMGFGRAIPPLEHVSPQAYGADKQSGLVGQFS